MHDAVQPQQQLKRRLTPAPTAEMEANTNSGVKRARLLAEFQPVIPNEVRRGDTAAPRPGAIQQPFLNVYAHQRRLRLCSSHLTDGDEPGSAARHVGGAASCLL